MIGNKLESLEEESKRQYEIRENKIIELIRQNEELEHGHLIYIPHKFCKIDRALAQFINTYPERNKMQIMFLRESEGVYRFGQSRVNVKVEKSQNVIVRVGGGFVSVAKFIEMYTPLELRALKRKNDVVQKFHYKILSQQIASRQSISRNESVPVGKHQRAKSANVLMHSKRKIPVIKRDEDNNSVSDKSFDKALVNTFHSQMFNDMNNSQTTAAKT